MINEGGGSAGYDFLLPILSVHFSNIEWGSAECCSLSEAALQRCSYKKLFWKYAANLQENAHAEVLFQSNFIDITIRHGRSPVNLLHIFRTPFESLKEVMESFFNVKNFESSESDGVLFRYFFFSIKNFKSRKKVTKSFFQY